MLGDEGGAFLMRKQAFVNIDRRKRGLTEIEFSSKEKKRAFMEAYDTTMKVVKYLMRLAPVYTIYGNVESSNAYTKKYSKEIGLPLPSLTNNLKRMRNVKVINNRLAKFKGIKIGGLEYFIDDIWVKTFKPSNYSDRLKSAKKETAKAKKILNYFRKVDILVCHQPPHGILDKVTFAQAPKSWKGKHAGSKVILDYIKKEHPPYVFCGHIHEGEGYKKFGKSNIYNLGFCKHKIIDI